MGPIKGVLALVRTPLLRPVQEEREKARSKGKRIKQRRRLTIAAGINCVALLYWGLIFPGDE